MQWKAAIQKPLKQYRFVRGNITLLQGDPEAIDRVLNRCLSAVAFYDDVLVCDVPLLATGVVQLIINLITYRGGWLGAEHVRDGFICEAGLELRSVVASHDEFNSSDPEAECKAFAGRFWAYLAGQNIRVSRRSQMNTPQESETLSIIPVSVPSPSSNLADDTQDPLQIVRPPPPINVKVPIQPPIVINGMFPKKRGRPIGPRAPPRIVQEDKSQKD